MNGFVMIPTHVMRDRTLTGTARLLYGIILSYAWGSNPCTASNQTLCDDAGCGRSAMYEALRSLKAAKLITVKKEEGTRLIRPVMKGGVRIPDSDDGEKVRESGIRNGDTEVDEGTDQVETSPSRAGVRAKASAELPNGFPEDLKPHARQVYAILRDVAGRFGAKEVTPRAVGHAILAAPGRHYVEEAHKMAGWCEGTNRPVKDVAARYQRWLSNADVYAGTEHLGAPIAASTGSNVHRMRPRGGGGTPWSAADMAAIAQRYLDEEAQGTA